jgi:hypothetical protein
LFQISSGLLFVFVREVGGCVDAFAGEEALEDFGAFGVEG